LMVWLRGPYPSDQIERAIRDTPGVARFESWFITEGVLTAEDTGADTTVSAPRSGPPPLNTHNKGGTKQPPDGSPHKANPIGNIDFTVIALPPESRMTKLEIAEGRDLQPGDTDAIVISQALASKSAKMKVGNTVTFHMGPVATPWRVVGISRESMLQLNAYIPEPFIEQRHPGMRTTVILALNKDKANPTSIYAITADLDRRLVQAGIRVAGSRGTAESRIPFDEHLLMIYVFLVVVSGIIVAVGALGLATSMSLNIMERRREIGVLRAIGASPSTLWLMIVTESAFIAVVSWAVAALVAWPVSKFVGDQFVGSI